MNETQNNHQPFLNLLNWANERGDSGGAMRARKFLMSLFNPRFYHYSVGDAVSCMDTNGLRLLMSALVEFINKGETEELRIAGIRIIESGWIDGWREEIYAAHSAMSAVRDQQERDQENFLEANEG